MTRHRRSMSVAVALGTGALVVAGALPASAHQHPTPLERAAPGVVFVQTQAQVDVVLVEHRQVRDPSGVHIVITQSTWNPVMTGASGFVVERTGTIVTTGGITGIDPNRAEVYAVNQAFHQAYGTPLPADPFARQQIGPETDARQQRLEACYPPQVVNDSGGCAVTVTPTYVVYPYVTDQAKYGNLKAELLPSSTPDVALLQVHGASSMPTVALAKSTEGAHALSDLGFTGPFDANHPLVSVDSHLQQVGGEVLKTQGLEKDERADQVKLIQAVPAGLLGGPVVAEEGQVIGFLVPPAQGPASVDNPPRLVDATAIGKVLTAEGITARRGPVDTTFEAAMHPFKNGAYSAAIPNLEQTLALYPGHAVAAQDLAKAKQSVASGETQASPGTTAIDQDTAAPASSGRSILPIAVTVVVVLLLLGVGAFLLMRRRRAAAETSATPAPKESPSGARAAVPVAAGSVRRREQSSSGLSTPTSPPAGVPVGNRAAPQRAGGDRTSGERAGTQGAPSGPASARSSAKSSARTPGDSGSPSRPGVPGAAQESAGPARQVPKQPSAPSSGAVGAPAGRARPDGGSVAPGRERGMSTPPSGPARGRPSRLGPRVSPGSPRDVRSEQSPAVKPLFCTACGTKLVPDDRYCPRCGHQTG